MSQVTNGIRAVLSGPFVYKSVQRMMVSERRRRLAVLESVCPQTGDCASSAWDADRKRFGDRGTFHCRLLQQAEVLELEPFDVVLGLGVLHHLDNAGARGFMSLVAAALGRGQHIGNAEGYRALPEGIAVAIKGPI